MMKRNENEKLNNLYDQLDLVEDEDIVETIRNRVEDDFSTKELLDYHILSFEEKRDANKRKRKQEKRLNKLEGKNKSTIKTKKPKNGLYYLIVYLTILIFLSMITYIIKL